MRIELDPQTERELTTAIKSAYKGFVESLDEEDVEEMDGEELAQTFFVNGFTAGCLAMLQSEDLKETIYVMDQEIKLQQK